MNDMVTIYATDYDSNNPQDTFGDNGYTPDGFQWTLNHEGTDGKQDESAEGNSELTAQQ